VTIPAVHSRETLLPDEVFPPLIEQYAAQGSCRRG